MPLWPPAPSRVFPMRSAPELLASVSTTSRAVNPLLLRALTLTPVLLTRYLTIWVRFKHKRNPSSDALYGHDH